MQGGGGETGDGVSLGLTEETHGAERVTAEERGGGAQGDLSILILNLTPWPDLRHRHVSGAPI